MKRKETNDEIYRYLMELKENDVREYAERIINVKCDDIISARRNGNEELARIREKSLLEFALRSEKIYGIGFTEVFAIASGFGVKPSMD